MLILLFCTIMFYFFGKIMVFGMLFQLLDWYNLASIHNRYNVNNSKL